MRGTGPWPRPPHPDVRSAPEYPRPGQLPGPAALSPGRLGLLDLRRQLADMGERPLHPLRRHAGRAAPGLGQAGVPAHRALGRPEGASAVDALQFGTPRVVQPDAHGRPEQPGEHVAVHERAEVTEHRLDLDRRVVRKHGPEEVLVRLARLGNFHDPPLGPQPGRYQACVAAWNRLNTAPCGSVTTAIFPIGVANGGTMTEPPSSVILAAEASASATAKYTCQWFGTPSICGGVVPPTSLPPTWNIVYLFPSISTVAVVTPSTCS